MRPRSSLEMTSRVSTITETCQLSPGGADKSPLRDKSGGYPEKRAEGLTGFPYVVMAGSWTTMSTLSISSAEYDQNESPRGCCRVDSWSSSTSVTVRVLDGGVAEYYESFFHQEVHELEYYDRTGEARFT